MTAERKMTPELQQSDFFTPGKNCTYAMKATHAAVVVDCGNYYRNLHESISKAKHSIFILGWDIDSRIKLIRHGSGLDPKAPDNLYKLLLWKAKANPDLRIYLNRWNYAFFMAGIREPLASLKWLSAMRPNIFYCRDNHVPIGASQHQKIVVIDDEVAYCGGMDVAIGRWDMRDHKPDNPHRRDPGGLYDAVFTHTFNPYHDIQTVVSGPAAHALGQIARERWRLATGFDAVPIRPVYTGQDVPRAWPDSDPPDFVDIDTGISRTIPAFANSPETYEIEQVYLDQIATAKEFIYIENQFLTRRNIAEALNEQMRKEPNLRVLILSSYNPQGVVEKNVMWVGRIKFKEIVSANGMENRVAMAYPVSRHDEKGDVPVRIHSKIMVVDDRFLHIGSSNLNNRSMRMDSECDVIYEGKTDAQCRKIADVRNDLIREHTGYEADDIEAMVKSHASPSDFLKRLDHSTQHMVAIDDMVFFDTPPTEAEFEAAGDPGKEIIPELPIPLPDGRGRTYFQRHRVKATFFFILAILAIGIVWKSGFLSDFASQEKLIQIFTEIREAPGTIPIAIAVFVACLIAFIPITLMAGVMAVVFGYGHGFLISLSGAAITLILGFAAGRFAGPEILKFFAGPTVERIKTHARNTNIATVTLIRMLPVAPFNIVNMAFGILKVPFVSFMIGSMLGLLPGTLLAIFVGQSVGEFWTSREPVNIAMIAAGVICWIGAIWGSHVAFSHWQARNSRKQP